MRSFACRRSLKAPLVLILLTVQLKAWNLEAAPLTDQNVARILADRVDVDKTAAAIVVGILDKDGSRTISHGVAVDSPGAAPSADTVFEIGSVTKVLTSLLLADMVVRGEVALSDPVARYLPDAVSVPQRNGRQITLLDLATHTSGLPRLPDDFGSGLSADAWAGYTAEQMYAFLSRHTLTRDIGAQEEYSNLGVGLLGHALALKAGLDFDSLVRERVTGPLGMQDTGTTPTASPGRVATGHLANGEVAPYMESATLAAAGGLHSTPADMLRLLSAAIGNSPSPLRAAFELMEHPVADNPEIRLAWGFNDDFDSQILWHQGSTLGFASYIGIDKRLQRGVFVLSNTRNTVTDIGFKTLNDQHDLIEQPRRPSSH